MNFTAWAHQVIVQSLPKAFEIKLNFACNISHRRTDNNFPVVCHCDPDSSIWWKSHEIRETMNGKTHTSDTCLNLSSRNLLQFWNWWFNWQFLRLIFISSAGNSRGSLIFDALELYLLTFPFDFSVTKVKYEG